MAKHHARLPPRQGAAPAWSTPRTHDCGRSLRCPGWGRLRASAGPANRIPLRVRE
eukprot:CAMPEP_0176149188 /NCGR_PEP_ID=MMETSP0120_2-20121206/76112_1 /TAXON_ID=160619 /ORGANISM="Kryptoperidinium foliaceum, Strain CCMP 1326" /LENGTH=54 /DNA_ID=CAMNT_0017485957 /DNA_START=8 /DNA_END=169 /DNA_ORIENTATION=+